jgi:hypothetical protein
MNNKPSFPFSAALAASAILVPSTIAYGAISLGDAQSFAVLGASTVTSTGDTFLVGDLGVSPGTAITGFFGTVEDDGPGTFSGSSYQGPLTFAAAAQADALSAYNIMAGLAYTVDLTGQDLGGLTLTPGVYNFDTSAQLTGILTLDGPGEYIFQIGSTLTTATSSSILLLNGANPFDSIFWQVGSSATLFAGTAFAGSILADQSVILQTGTSLDGRAIALNAAVTLDNNYIQSIPEPGTWAALSACGMMLLVTRHRSCRALHTPVEPGNVPSI